ncbi:MAG: D-alanyl-D-alanine carboxypeptidase family protein [Acidimicrobiales bacterium]
MSSTDARHVLILGGGAAPRRTAATAASQPAELHLVGPSDAPLPTIPSHLRRRPRRSPWLIPVVATAVMGVVFVSQLTRSVPSAAAVITAPPAQVVGGTAPALPWPSVGTAAVAVPAAGWFSEPAPEASVPVASLTKIMTAYLVLRDHPLAMQAQGPIVTMTADDQQDATANALGNQTSVPLTAGQQFSERQLLDGLLVHSANDFATALARWDAGSVPGFVAKMNAEAQQLHLAQTHYVDPDGVLSGSVSTAADQLRLAELAMTIPTFAAVVAQPTVSFPGVGVLSNYVPIVGSYGVVGVKSGFTQAAMGCVVLAADRVVDGHTLLVMAAATGQNDGVAPVDAAERVALRLIDAAAGGIQHVDAVGLGRRVATLAAPWTVQPVAVVTTGDQWLWAWPGDTVRFAVALRHVRGATAAGAVVGQLQIRHGTQLVTVPLRTESALTGATLRWRYSHG